MNKLVTVTDTSLIKLFENNKDITLLYPLEDYTVGYELTFKMTDIHDFCLINRSLNDNELDQLESILQTSHIKGIVFDDLGVLELIKDLNITKILLLDHIATNISSINYYLDYVDSVVVSNDLTYDEIKNILELAYKKLVVNVFGLKTLMYSRRTLLSNYEEHYKITKESKIDASIEDKKFKIIENKYGTVFYAFPYYNALELLKLSNVLYYWYTPLFLNFTDTKKVILDNNLEGIPTDSLFLDKKTYYKLD
jgi:hypothetical protein